jgi:hypothetical protein
MDRLHDRSSPRRLPFSFWSKSLPVPRPRGKKLPPMGLVLQLPPFCRDRERVA